MVSSFTPDDSLIFNNKPIKINPQNFQDIPEISAEKTLAFVDGGQAEIIAAGNFSLGFIRVVAQFIRINKEQQEKTNLIKNEFYLLTTAKYQQNEIYYESKIFSLNSKLFDENLLFLSSQDSSIKTSAERAPINKIANIARRFAELSLAKIAAEQADFVLLDGTLESTFNNENIFLQKLPEKVSALAKTSSLFTTSGNSPVVLLNKIGPKQQWSYYVDKNTYFVKMHPQSKHIFRFERDKELLPYLTENSTDALFLGYPYGLILADKLARVSNEEKKSLKMIFLLRTENKEIAEYLTSSNAHEILDHLG